MRYVIVGSGPAGLSSVEGIREIDKVGEILLVTADKQVGYSKPLITYLLGNMVEKSRMFYKAEQFLQQNDVDCLVDTKITQVSTKEKLLITADGKKIKYDKLLIATGGEPIVPSIDGLKQQDGIFTFTTLEDAERIEKYLSENSVGEAVVLGGGLIGLKTTEALLKLGLKVKVIELSDRILAATFDQKASKIIEDSLKREGCEVITNDTIVKIKGRKRISKVVLKSGREIETKLLIIAIGVRPNVEFLKSSDIKINRGIVVGEKMQTNIEDIYAAGDCVESLDLIEEKYKTIAIWPIAVSQGKVAGYNMAGKSVKYPGGIPMNSIELAGVPTISVGYTNVAPSDGIGILVSEFGNTYKKIVLKNNRIVGVVLVNNIDRAGIYTGLILQKADVSSFKDRLLDEDFGLVYLPREFRKKMLEGEIKVWLE